MTEDVVRGGRLSKIRESYRNSTIAQFFSYMGPAVLVSIAYMDPGNYGTDIQGGAAYNYDLLWIVWLASAMAMILQYLWKIQGAFRLLRHCSHRTPEVCQRFTYIGLTLFKNA